MPKRTIIILVVLMMTMVGCSVSESKDSGFEDAIKSSYDSEIQQVYSDEWEAPSRQFFIRIISY